LEILKRNDETTTAFIKNSAFLLEVLSKLNSADLSDVFIAGGMELLNSLGAENLVKVLVNLNSNLYSLKSLLTNEKNLVLKFLLEYPDQLVEVLVELESGELKEVLKRKENGVLAFLLEHPDQLIKMLNEYLNHHNISLDLKIWPSDTGMGRSLDLKI
jgi:hypothetical protein